jgi:hypothetical protein
MPAGAYNIGSNSDNPNILAIEDQRTKTYVLAVGILDHRGDGGTRKLVFHKVGNEYFLREILCASPSMNVALPGSNLEKRARTKQIASVSGGDVVRALN